MYYIMLNSVDFFWNSLNHLEFTNTRDEIHDLTLEGVECETQKAPSGWDLGKGVLLPSWSCVWEGLYPFPRNLCEIHVEFTNFAAFCEDYNSLRLTKFSK